MLIYAEQSHNEPTTVLHSILDWITIIYYMYIHNDTLFLVESCFDSETTVKDRNMTNLSIGSSHPPGWGNKSVDDEQLKWNIWDALGCYICFCSSVDMYSFHLIARVSFQQGSSTTRPTTVIVSTDYIYIMQPSYCLSSKSKHFISKFVFFCVLLLLGSVFCFTFRIKTN